MDKRLSSSIDLRRRAGLRRGLAAFLLAAIALAFLSLPALAEGRFALVIGNGAYKGVPALANPPNDAKDIAAALKSLGFTVTLGIDLDQAGMQRAIAEFAGQAAEADASLFYYAGHGVQLAGRNYLIPVGAELRTPADIGARTIALDPVLAELGKGRGSHFIFLDACRNNPFAKSGVTLPSAGLARVGRLPDSSSPSRPSPTTSLSTAPAATARLRRLCSDTWRRPAPTSPA